MTERVCIIGLDEPEFTDIQKHTDVRIVAHPMLPRLLVRNDELLVESANGMRMVPVSRIVFHGIFEEDLDSITALALWGGPCLPNARGMMDCRLKFPCLVRALQYTRFGAPLRGFAGRGVPFESDSEHVAKWGNWHCGENKARFQGVWTNDEACIIEPFLRGHAERIVLVGKRHWQIHLEGDDWLKSIHHPRAGITAVDADLLADTQTIGAAFGLEIVANDYIVTDEGTKHLLEVNHIPNVTQFPEIWEAYRDFVVAWLGECA